MPEPLPGLSILELLLQIVKLAMEGQTVDQRKQMWDWYIKDVQWWRTHLGIDP